MTIESETRARKLNHLRAGRSPRILELCSGCGGMSLGFAAAGFSLVAHIESDPVAAHTYAQNFDPPRGVSKALWSQPRDMEDEEPYGLIHDLGLEATGGDAIDVITAGLPCQAFARIGRSKLRSVVGDEEAYRNDARAKLYVRLLEYVEQLHPLAIVIENVPDILNFGGHNVPEEICETLDQLGYTSAYTLLNAAYYGVPQMRERLFLIAIDRSLDCAPAIPEPSRSFRLPSGYDGARSFALRHVLPEGSHFLRAPAASASLPPAISVREALADLPFISEHWRNPGAMRRRQVSDELPYRDVVDPSAYARLMREWPRYSTNGAVMGNVVRITPRDFETFRTMRPRDDYPRAVKVAEEIFERKLAAHAIRPRRGSAAWKLLRKQSVPPYDPGKFPNKWWKLDPALPSRTLTAHLGKDTYSHIHWDSRQQRTISVREAARLQSFPDGFRFSGAMNAAFRQIGNAVPPLLALAVATCVKKVLTSSTGDRAQQRVVRSRPAQESAVTG